MARTSIKQIFVALQAVITTMRAGDQVNDPNAYSIDLLPGKVIQPKDQDIINSREQEDYPKILFILDSGRLQQQPAQRSLKTIRAAVQVFVREVTLDDPTAPPPDGWKSVQDIVRDLVDDLQNIILRNVSLGGIVTSCVPSDFETDSDFTWPEGVVIQWYDIQYFDR